jgi:tetratricopeptide (TPR) repeat protein
MERKNYAAALAPLEKAVALCEGYELARNALGECYLRLGRNEEAVIQFKEVLKMNPVAAKTRNFLGVAYASLKNYNDAQKQFTAALAKDPEFLNAHLNLGRLYEMMAETSKALKQYEKASVVTKDPVDKAVIYIRMGDVYLKLNSPEEARACYQKAKIAAPDSSSIQTLAENKLKEV